MIVVALSCVCDYGMAQDPALGLTVTMSALIGKRQKPKMILLVLPKQCTVIENE